MSNKEAIIEQFDPNNAADFDGIYGLPFSLEESNIVLIPVPWEGTVSYGTGTSKGPEAIYQASFQVDLFDPYVKDAWKSGIYMTDINYQWEPKQTNQEYINKQSHSVNEWVEKKSNWVIDKNKIPGIIGGEHSSPFGLIKALSEHHGEIDILQIDAHADLRNSYEGYLFSHASIMYNAMKLKGVEKLHQVGIRDFCENENELMQNDPRINTFFDHEIKEAMFSGENWEDICGKIIAGLGNKVYISFDIDGLTPELCPNTGTPVPGGLTFEQAIYLIKRLVEKGKTIVGFDLCEVAPGKTEWDGNVGARVLYRLCNLTAKSNKLI